MTGTDYKLCRYCDRAFTGPKSWCTSCHRAYVYGFWGGTLCALVYAGCVAVVTLLGAVAYGAWT